MTTIVNMHDAKTHLSRLVERVAQGETVVLAKSGKPIAKMVKLDDAQAKKAPRYGFMRGKVPEDFDRMFEDEIAEMFGAS